MDNIREYSSGESAFKYFGKDWRGGYLLDEPENSLSPKKQLVSYFSQFSNDFYIKYLPFVTLTIIFMRLFKVRQRL